MKTLILTLSLLSFSALADTNGVYNLPKQKSFTHATITFTPAYPKCDYKISLQVSGGVKAKATAVGIKTNSFTVFCSVGTTNLVWSVKHK